MPVISTSSFPAEVFKDTNLRSGAVCGTGTYAYDREASGEAVAGNAGRGFGMHISI